jgi:uncharacterized protein YqgV (UPF0045/DUF77 family)
MNTSRLILIVVFFLALLSTGCARYHHGRPLEAKGPSMSEVVPEVKELVEQHVKDPEKAKQVQAMIQEIVQEVKRSSQEIRGFHEQLTALNTNYDASPEQFIKVLDEMNHARMASAGKILSTRFKIKGLLSPQEWKNITDAMAKVRSRYTKGEGV